MPGRRDIEFPLRADGHHGEGLCPAFDYLVGTESSRFVALVRAIEFCSVNQRTFVVYFHLAAVGRNGTVTLGDDFVLQTARGSYYTFFSLVLSQELFTGSFVVSVFLL